MIPDKLYCSAVSKEYAPTFINRIFQILLNNKILLISLIVIEQFLVKFPIS
jgi:hypothetical protein